MLELPWMIMTLSLPLVSIPGNLWLLFQSYPALSIGQDLAKTLNSWICASSQGHSSGWAVEEFWLCSVPVDSDQLSSLGICEQDFVKLHSLYLAALPYSESLFFGAADLMNFVCVHKVMPRPWLFQWLWMGILNSANKWNHTQWKTEWNFLPHCRSVRTF